MPENKLEKLLVVEDEENVGSTLTERLKQEGFDVTWVQTVEDATLEISNRKFDLALLDIGLPDGNGFKVAKSLRAASRHTAMIFLTAFGNPEDRIKGLEIGAEDYIVKPFHLKELLLRVRNVLKRTKYLSKNEIPDGYQIGKAKLYLSRFEAESGSELVSLSHKESALLKLLLERKGQVVSREEILREIWNEEEFPTSRTIDNFVMKLRRLVEKDPEDPKMIKSIRGVGYLIKEDES